MDERTPVLQLPLPHPDHLLSEDVLRLREALVTVDAGFGQQRTEVQAELTQARSDVDAALAEVSTQLTRQLHRLRMNQLLDLNL